MITLHVYHGYLEARGARPEDHDYLIALRDLWEERAGILEHQACLTRTEAEHRALADCEAFWTDPAKPRK